MVSSIVDQHGKPFVSAKDKAVAEVMRLRREISTLRSSYDAAQDVYSSENHWAQADSLDPHSAASLQVRKKLRNRSRYEIIENNPYLKGILLSICNDFIGSGPRLQITDKRLSKERRRLISAAFSAWAKQIKLRRKLWRMRLARTVDGESFCPAYQNKKLLGPLKLDFWVVEADRISSEEGWAIAPQQTADSGVNQVDGVRYDGFDNPLEYHLLNSHPGSNLWINSTLGGQWIKSDFMPHWFRQDRGWLRGIPELTPSLPLCALLRRYTLAIVRAAEVGADFAAVIETEGPPSANLWTDGAGNQIQDSPWDIFPIEMGQITTLPWGHKLKEMGGKTPPIIDAFIDSLLRMIVRPLLITFNRASGSSQDSNMASSVVDDRIYTSGIQEDRFSCDEDILDQMLGLWWFEATRIPGFLDDPLLREADFLQANPSLMIQPPLHRWRWDKVGVEHTDPLKVSKALEVLRDNGFSTDRDIQEEYYNRDVDDWREEIEEDQSWRQENLGAIPQADSQGESTPVDEEEEE